MVIKMCHESFLLVLSQLAQRNKARIVKQGSVIFVETLPVSKKWKLSTPVYSGQGYIPHSVRECVGSSSGTLRFQSEGAYLKLDEETHNVNLIQEIESSVKYVPFRYSMRDFAKVAEEWREILDEFARRDHVPIHIE